MIYPRIRINNNVIYYDLWRGIITSKLRAGEITDDFLGDLAQVGMLVGDVAKYAWIVDLNVEGHNAADVEPFRQLLISYGLPDDQFGVIFSCFENTDDLPYHAICLPTRLIHNGNWLTHLKTQQVDWKNLPMVAKLTCLMRRPSLERCHLAKRVLNAVGYDNLIITLGTNDSDVGDDFKQLIHPFPWPLVVDSPSIDYIEQHKISHETFYKAPLNLVVESSSQTDENVWTSQFITEKSFKALAWYQFPIWYAVPGLVGRIRDLGFDVFDDVWNNHNYDTIQDPPMRMTEVVKQVNRVNQINTVQLRTDLWDRLKNNALLVDEIHTSAFDTNQLALEGLENELV